MIKKESKLSTSKLTPTSEQQEIINLFANNPTKGSIKLKINAYAGASKTTTLMMVAEHHTKSSLYITFNKKMSVEASGKFPSHVEVRTSHSVAYRAVGFKYQDKLSRPAGKYQNVLGTGKEVAMFFKLKSMSSGDKTLPSASIGYCIIDTVNSFEYSSDRELSIKHVDLRSASKLTISPTFNSDELVATVFKHAKQLWNKRIDLHDNTLSRHDTYMKLYQLMDPVLNYDTIYLDEAQDANPCLVDILLKQTSNLVFVGDKHQSIYGFRGAINAMSIQHKGHNWTNKRLTKSFRFGPKLAEVATSIIQANQAPVQGYEILTTDILDEIPENVQYTMLFRTNAALVMRALELAANDISFHLELDISTFVNMLESCIALKAGNLKKVRHSDIQMFENWSEFVIVAKQADPELAKFVDIIEGGNGERALAVLSDYTPPTSPQVVMTTAHRAKGLEYDYVYLADDFQIPKDLTKLSTGERNLIYVGATRAKRGIRLNRLANSLIAMNN